MVTRGNVNTARITRYRSYEAVIGERGGGGRFDDQLIFFCIDTSSVLEILMHLYPERKFDPRVVKLCTAHKSVVQFPE